MLLSWIMQIRILKPELIFLSTVKTGYILHFINQDAKCSIRFRGYNLYSRVYKILRYFWRVYRNRCWRVEATTWKHPLFNLSEVGRLPLRWFAYFCSRSFSCSDLGRLVLLFVGSHPRYWVLNVSPKKIVLQKGGFISILNWWDRYVSVTSEDGRFPWGGVLWVNGWPLLVSCVIHLVKNLWFQRPRSLGLGTQRGQCKEYDYMATKKGCRWSYPNWRWFLDSSNTIT